MRDDIPWGRPPVTGIPTPPFADALAGQRFHQALAEHLTVIAGRSPTFDLTGFALLSALGDRRAPSARLEPWVLRVAVSTFFPAPWTPGSFVAAVRDSGLTSGDWYVEADAVGYRSDPDFHAARSATGAWTASFVERGQSRVDAELATDDDLVLYLMDLLRRNPYPLGWKPADDDRLAAITAGVDPVLAAWRRHADLPYIADWTAR
jgi:hypothetical protein